MTILMTLKIIMMQVIHDIDHACRPVVMGMTLLNIQLLNITTALMTPKIIMMRVNEDSNDDVLR